MAEIFFSLLCRIRAKKKKIFPVLTIKLVMFFKFENTGF